MTSRALDVDRSVVAAAIALTCVLFLPAALDPVNVIKLTVLVLCALLLMGSTAYRVLSDRVVHFPTRPATWAVAPLALAFVISAAVAPVKTTAVLGAYGRNSGLLAYLSAAVIFFAAVRVARGVGVRHLTAGVVIAGLFTAAYGLLQRLGLDAVPWNNPFNPIIAALGNPNFASGYLGIAAGVALGGALWSGWRRSWRVLSGVTSALCVLVAVLSKSVQGPIAAAAGFFVVAVALVLEQPALRRRVGLAVLGGGALAATATLLLGAAAQVGPAASVFADYGSQARTHYWTAALEMLERRPALGVGLDQYGQFWRSSRSAESVTFLGNGYSDAAHSVPLQMLAQGGLILGLSYLAFVLLVGATLVRGLLRLAGAERMALAGVGAGWAAYQVQSLVSIDQVPLIVLHFGLAGGVIALSGTEPLREIRLPGALTPAKVHPNDARAKRRAAPSAPTRRPLTTGDAAGLGVLGLVLLFGTWTASAPLRANVSASRGDALLAQGDGNGALAAYEHAVKLVPGSAVYRGREGALYERVQQTGPARRAWEQATEADPYDLTAVTTAATLAEAAGDVSRARELFQRLVEVDPLSPDSLVRATTFELRHNGAEAARTTLERAVRQLPGSAPLWATLGDARAVLGDGPGARQAYERALELEPGQATATAGMAKL